MQKRDRDTIEKYYVSIKTDVEIVRPYISPEIFKVVASMTLVDFIDTEQSDISSAEALGHLLSGKGIKELISHLKEDDSKFETRLLIVMLYLYYTVLFASTPNATPLNPARLKVFITCLTIPSDRISSVEYAI